MERRAELAGARRSPCRMGRPGERLCVAASRRAAGGGRGWGGESVFDELLDDVEAAREAGLSVAPAQVALDRLLATRHAARSRPARSSQREGGMVVAVDVRPGVVVVAPAPTIRMSAQE